MQRAIFGMAMLALATALPSAPAAANDLGCQVLLCLSNPGGATQYAQCVSPMTKLWQRLATGGAFPGCRSEEHTSELQSLMRISYAVFCLKKIKTIFTRQ